MSFKHLVFAAFSTVILATTFSDSPLGKMLLLKLNIKVNQLQLILVQVS